MVDLNAFVVVVDSFVVWSIELRCSAEYFNTLVAQPTFTNHKNLFLQW